MRVYYSTYVVREKPGFILRGTMNADVHLTIIYNSETDATVFFVPQLLQW